MMDAVDEFEFAHGIYPIAFDRRWHCGAHLAPDVHGPVHAIADREVVAYRVCQHAMDSGNGNAGFVLLKHSTETGEGRTLTFYSLYMHLLPLAEYQSFGHDRRRLPEFFRKPTGHGARITGSYDWRNGNCDRVDAQKFRGRGFKQLTGRSNYSDYWVFKSWISTTSFSASWWQDPAFIAHNRSGVTKVPAMIDEPQRVSLRENCLDSGGFYLRFSRPNVAKRIDQDPRRWQFQMGIRRKNSRFQGMLHTRLMAAISMRPGGSNIPGLLKA